MTTTPSTAEILDERISDAMLSARNGSARLDNCLALAAIAIPCILRAAAAGNVQCKQAVAEMTPYLNKIHATKPK